MNGDRLKVLMVEDNADFVYLIRKAMAQVGEDDVDLAYAYDLNTAQAFLHDQHFDAIVLDLALPDSDGLHTFHTIQSSSPNTPVVVLTAQDGMDLARDAVRNGAQDYLIKGKVNGQLLVRSLRYAIERQQMVDTLRRLALIDELTGLYNRRGFVELANQQLMLSGRTERHMLLFLMDIDGLKDINDHFGHAEGDKALINLAATMRKTFRSSDILARLGGDEFAVLAIDVPKQSAEHILARLKDHLERTNVQYNGGYELSVSTGLIEIVEYPAELNSLMEQVDSHLYTDKRQRQPLRLRN